MQSPFNSKKGGGLGGWQSEGGLLAAPRHLMGDLTSWKHNKFQMKKSSAGYVLPSSRPSA